MSEHKYTMKMSLNVLNHLGLRLYSNIPAVLSEAVANAYDADASVVEINIDTDAQIVTLSDNGSGMSLEDINDKFLLVGYSKRQNGEGITPIYQRAVMGRKGIGKLSLFSIANQIEVHTIKNGVKSGLIMNRFKIEEEIERADVYHPDEVDHDKITIKEGTLIILSDFKRQINYSAPYLKQRLARRFSVIGDRYNFNISVNGENITLEDRNFFKKVQFLWLIGDQEEKYEEVFDFEKVQKFDGNIEGTGYKISGWIGAVEFPSDLKDKTLNNNKISIICRGKMAQEDILDSFPEGGIYADYLIGEIRADFLDIDKDEDIATSSRQKINEEDPRYRDLEAYIYKILKKIQSVWTSFRTELNTKQAVSKAIEIHPSLATWYDSLVSEKRKEYARDLFATIENFHMDKSEPDYIKKKRDLYIQGIVAFEKLRLRDSLNELSRITSPDDLKLAKIFADLNDLEANLYFDIAQGRVEVITKFQNLFDENVKEKILQEYIFDNLWILNPSWERPTAGSPIMEQKVEKEFNKAVSTLTDEERKGRMDIKYRTTAGKHIIIELKRYNPTYNVSPIDLYIQLKKYKEALSKCIAATDDYGAPIELIAILGQVYSHKDQKEAEDLLTPLNARIIYYDYLIDQSLKSYEDYLDKQKQISKLRAIIEEVRFK